MVNLKQTKMNKQSRSTKKISVSQLISVFQQKPEKGYQLLISSGVYFKNKKHTQKFWTLLNLEELYALFPKSSKILDKVQKLKFFYELDQRYLEDKIKYQRKIIELNPSPEALIKSFFICLELGETNPYLSEFPGYTEEALEAVKVLLKEVSPNLKSENHSAYSASLVDLSNHLIKLQLDLALIADFLDAFVSGDFELSQKKDNQGFSLSSVSVNKTANLYILNHLKSSVKKDFIRRNSHSEISNEEHFKKYDSKWKTNEGLIGAFYSSGVILKEQTPGLTSLEVEDSLFEDIRSEDPKIRENGFVKQMEILMEANFHYQYRQALSTIYHPNDEIDIHNLKIEISENVIISLYELVCAMSCLIAKADCYRYLGDFPKGSIGAVKRDIYHYAKEQSPELTEKEINSKIDASIIQSLTELELHGVKAFHFIEYSTILKWFRQIEELKNKKDEELGAIVKLFSADKTPLLYNPLYKVNNNYYFSCQTCHKLNINSLLYDYYISDELFNSRNKAEEKQLKIDRNQKLRVISFTDSIKDLFKTITPFVEARLEFNPGIFESGQVKQKGDFDVIAYFEDENIIFPIEVKLNNVSPRTEKRKSEWVATNIEEKATDQINKSVGVLQTDEGLMFVSEKLNFHKKIINPSIYPIIITDNFFADHVSYKYNEKGDGVICISYFELKHLIIDKKVHPKQIELSALGRENRGMLLIKAIEENNFWNFIVEFADEFRLSKTLSVIEDKFKIEMSV